MNKKRDAIWCVIALCHDLGYSLAKLSQLNEKVKNVLKHFDLLDFRRIGYSLDIEHHYIASQFLELMSMDVRVNAQMDLRRIWQSDYWPGNRPSFNYRPVTIMSYAAVARIEGPGVILQRAANIALHPIHSEAVSAFSRAALEVTRRPHDAPEAGYFLLKAGRCAAEKR